MTKNSSYVCRIESVIVRENGILVDAQQLNRPSVQFTNTPILTNFSGIVTVPQVGQRIVVSKDDTGFEYVEGILAGPDDPTPILEENEFLLQFDPETRITATEDGAGGYDISIEASGDILIGDSGEPVAKQNHTHPESGGGDTGTPNESGTETKIQ